VVVSLSQGSPLQPHWAQPAEPESPMSFLWVINIGPCWEHQQDTNSGRLGFTICQATVDHIQLHKHGIAAACEKTVWMQHNTSW
jgi:hypothetical protein